MSADTCDVIGCDRPAKVDVTLPGVPWVRRVCAQCARELQRPLP